MTPEGAAIGFVIVAAAFCALMWALVPYARRIDRAIRADTRRHIDLHRQWAGGEPRRSTDAS